jgi:hypothetical protein
MIKKSLNKFTIFFLLCYYISTPNSYDSNTGSCRWLSLYENQNKPSPVKLNVVNKDNRKLQIHLNVSGIYLEEIKENDKNYTVLSIPGYESGDQTGHPMVPEIIKCVAVPSSCTMNDIQINIIASNFRTLQNYKIAPVPKQIPKRSTDGLFYFQKEYIEDVKTYSADNFYPNNLIEIKETGYIRDQKVIWISIYPVRYNPAALEMHVYDNIEVNLSFNGYEIYTDKSLGPLDDFKQELFINYDSAFKHSMPFKNEAGQVTYPSDLLDPAICTDYLIITTNDLITNQALDSLAHHRAQFNGFDVAVVKDSDIYAQFPSDSKDKSIKDFLIYAYNHWQSSQFGDNHLGYVLFVGEGERDCTNELPTHHYKSDIDFEEAGSDYWYTCINDDNEDQIVDEDDSISDIIVGRFSVDNHQELNTAARKTIRYEENLEITTEWRKKVSLISGFKVPDSHSEPNRPSGWNLSPFFDELESIILEQDFYQISEKLNRSGLEPEDVRSSFIHALNSGRGIMAIHAHGSMDTWGDGGGWHLFHSSDISNLSNGSKLPVILSLSCITGRFSDPQMDCIGEVFVNTRNKGAIAFVGASEGVDINSNKILNKIMFENLAGGPNRSLGVIFYLRKTLGTFEKYYNILGDPALSFNRKIQHSPPDLSVSPADININWSPFPGEPERISVKIFNFGFETAENVVVQIFDDDPQTGGKLLCKEHTGKRVDKLGGYQTVHFLMDDVLSKEISIYVKIDPYDSIEEINETNNTAFIGFREPLFIDAAANTGIADTGMGMSTAFGDYNNDGYLDIFLVNTLQSDILFRNNAGVSFTDVSTLAGVKAVDRTNYVSFIDYDNDGNLDIYKGIWINSETSFYRNDGDGTFKLSNIYDKNGKPIKGRIIGFLDSDNDGFLDICSSDDKYPFMLYHNNGNNTNTDMTPVAGFDSTIKHSPLSLAFGDYNNDGAIDIFVPSNNVLFRNDGNVFFTNVTHISGIHNSGCSAVFGDYNNDENIDLLVSDNDSLFLYKNNGNETFTNITARAEIAQNPVQIYGRCTFFDYNNDGYLDIYTNSLLQILFKNNRDGTFSQDTSSIQKFVCSTLLGATLIGDYNNDGYIDIYHAVHRKHFNNEYRSETVPPKNILYKNQGYENNWIIVKTRGAQSNSYGIGARVKVVADDLIQIREVTHNISNLQVIVNSLPLEFGLGKHDHIDTVQVRWPSGIVDILTDVPVNTILTVKEGYGDIVIPDKCRLFQNYPNPFNSETTIDYVVKGNPHNPQFETDVNITVFNITGQKVITLIDKSQKPGYYSVKWNGSDRYGVFLPSGIYFYRLKSNNNYEIHRMVLIK